MNNAALYKKLKIKITKSPVFQKIYGKTLRNNKYWRDLLSNYREKKREKTALNFVRSMESYLQDYNAGNGGDRLRHALLLEVLQRIEKLDGWSYRETHAGAGIYPMTEHSRILLKALNKWDKKECAGAAYGHALLEWWNAGAPGYPGSITLAYRFIRKLETRNIDIRATEVDPVALSRLRVLVGEGIEIKADSFDKQLDWLCQGSFLVFIVDPYYYDRHATDTLQGRIGKVHLYDLFRRLSQKKGAILFVFTASPSDSIRKTQEKLLEDILCTSLVPISRNFMVIDKQLENKSLHNYYLISVVGFGEGIKIVKALPNASHWRASWLNMDLIKEFYDTQIEEIIY